MNEKEKNKKKKERISVKPILEFLNLQDEQCDWTGDKPDCRYTDEEGQVIGIEVARCTNDNDDVRQMNSLINQACSVCKNKLREEGRDNVLVEVHPFSSILRTRPKILKSDFYQCISEEIIRHIKNDEYIQTNKFLDDPEGYKSLVNSGHLDYKYIEDVQVVNGMPELDVVPVLAYLVPDISAEAVSRCIADKNKKLKKYRSLPENNHIKDYWLFIAVDWDSYTDLGQLPPIRVENDYSKIYICDYIKVVQIK